MVPYNSDEDGKLIEPSNTDHPFMRGIMNFDDYNYKTINQFVLIEEPVSSNLRKMVENDRKQLNTGKLASSHTTSQTGINMTE